MATRFELVLPGDHPPKLRAAAEAAFQEIQRAEAWLSVFQPGTPLAMINAQGYRRPIQVPPPVFALLVRARELTRLTDSYFDPTVGPWLAAGQDSQPSQADTDLQAAVGWDKVEMDPDRHSIRLLHPRARLDLGALGKGYALDRAVEVLQEAGVRNALLHGGTSSVWALGHPPEAEGWLVELGQPPTELLERGTPALPVRRLLLSDVSLSVSATWGRIVKTPLGGWRSHVLDPTTGLPVRGLHRAVVTGPSATDTEALSTGLLVAGPRRSARWQEAFPGTESTYD